MGVSNASVMMHRLTSSLFKGLSDSRSFYDDIYIFTKSTDINEHLQAIRIPCLGDFIGRNGVRIDPDKVQTIRNWPVPRTQDQLHSFLGLTGYAQRFCEQYAELIAPLFTLLKKKNQRNSKISLNADQLKNFKELQRRLADTPVLHLPDFTRRMHLGTDASQFAVGGVLFQVVDGVERPIVFTNRKMKSAELKKWRTAVSLDGTMYLRNTNQFSRIFLVPRMVLLMHSVEGRTLNLKRRSFHDLLVPSFNETSYQLRGAEIRPTSDLSQAIHEDYKKDKVIQEIRRVIEKRSDESTSQRLSAKQYKVYFVEDNLVCRIVVPNILSLKHKIIAEVHDANYGGHPAQEVATLFIENIWRPHGLPQDIVSDRDTKFISGFWSQVFEDVGAKLKLTVAYLAQGDGQTERSNRTLEEYLRCFVSPRQDNWDAHLANAEFAINSAANASITMSSFEADLGYVPANPLSALAASKRQRLKGGRQQGVKFTEHQAAVLLQCQEALEDAQAYMADVHDKGRKEQEFKVGDRVYLSTKNLDTAHTGFPNSRKLGP
ncbi:unnamed protein product [Phytophthora fragariaefolia]|uniref:Unnamed protein product n=1 Tax=Phytophthora fragariaefolia TaxID=1490495 RepID=A0A9W7CVG4_9STRA|nr:unnamed protein product [Phytophthora fragariaefolia]